jgi:hypothetical protein
MRRPFRHSSDILERRPEGRLNLPLAGELGQFRREQHGVLWRRSHQPVNEAGVVGVPYFLELPGPPELETHAHDVQPIAVSRHARDGIPDPLMRGAVEVRPGEAGADKLLVGALVVDSLPEDLPLEIEVGVFAHAVAFQPERSSRSSHSGAMWRN